jgi:hypothetical protein
MLAVSIIMLLLSGCCHSAESGVDKKRRAGKDKEWGAQGGDGARK